MSTQMHMYKPENEAREIGPRNRYLLACLMLGCPRGERLCFGPDMAGLVTEGLQQRRAFGKWCDPRFYELSCSKQLARALGS